MPICFYTVMRQTSFKGFSTIIIEKYSFRYIDYVLSLNNSWLSASYLSKRLKDTTDTQKSAYYLDNSSWNRQLWNIKNKTLRQTRWLYFSHSQLPLFQDHPRIEFTFHNSYVILWSVILADVAKTEHATLRRCSYAGVIVTKKFGRHHDLVDHYKISISQMTMDLFLYTRISLPLSLTRLLLD